MSFLNKIFKRRTQSQAMPDNVPYYWHTPEVVDEINRMLAKQLNELEAYTSKLSKLA